MTTAKTTSATTASTFYYATTYTTPFIITNTTMSNNTKTETVVSNNTVTTSTVPSSEINSTSLVSVVESSQTPCIPTTGYMVTTTLSDQSTTTAVQMGFDGTTCDFGDALDAPSAILIPANTLTWTNFQLQKNGSYFVGASIGFLAVPEAIGANVTVAFYLNGHHNSSTISQVSQSPNEVTNFSLIPSSNSSSNSIFALKGFTPTLGVGGQTGWAVSLNGTTIAIAFVSDKPLWLLGWTPEDMSKGTGPQFGQSGGQLNGTYEWPDPELSLPNSLPQPTTTLTFELRISGDYF